MEFDKDFFAENLIQLRELNSLTQKQLAEKIGLKTSTVGSYETGASLPSIDSLLKIATILNVSINKLLTGKEINQVSELAEAQVGYGIKEANDQLQKETTSLSRELAMAREFLEDRRKQIERLEGEKKKLEDRVIHLNGELDKCEKEVQSLKTQKEA